MDNRYLNILAHPTGRLINERPASAVDIERVMRGAVAHDCYLELDAQPDAARATRQHAEKLASNIREQPLLALLIAGRDRVPPGPGTALNSDRSA